jgi:Mrp family chromosome partitioning ATPase
VAAGALAGLGLGLGLALLLETRRRSPQTPAEIEALTGLANLGALPAVRRIGRHSPADRVSDRPGSAYAACMRRLLVSLDMGRANPGVVLVTSARRREGRTTTALALGRSAAAAGMNAVVIDCDSIEPALARAASLEPGRGMADLLSEPGHLPRLASVSMIDPRSGCSIVAAGSPGAGSAALLRAERLRAILAEARTNFDMVIIDGPCVESAAEALVLAKLAGTVLMVVRAGRTGPEHILSCQRQLERAGAPAIATVLNAAGSDALRPSPLP